jgi:hypothetical protein
MGYEEISPRSVQKLNKKMGNGIGSLEHFLTFAVPKK